MEETELRLEDGQSPAGRVALPFERLAARTLSLRGSNVLTDEDLAVFYGVSPKRLNEQVKRHRERFPEDFVFRLSATEMRLLRSQEVCDWTTGRGKHRKYPPHAFTEQGAAMLASVLRTPQALQTSIEVMRSRVRQGSPSEPAPSAQAGQSLVASVEAAASADSKALAFGPITVELTTSLVRVDGATALEVRGLAYRLLVALVLHGGRLVPWTHLEDHVFRAQVCRGTRNNAVYRLRCALGRAGGLVVNQSGACGLSLNAGRHLQFAALENESTRDRKLR